MERGLQSMRARQAGKMKQYADPQAGSRIRQGSCQVPNAVVYGKMQSLRKPLLGFMQNLFGSFDLETGQYGLNSNMVLFIDQNRQAARWRDKYKPVWRRLRPIPGGISPILH